MPSTRRKSGRERPLALRNCVPCRGGVPALGRAAQGRLVAQLERGWRVVNGHHLVRSYRFADFATALAFVNSVGALAEAEGHHPDLELGWGRVRITIWTHAIDGLTESDFILAAKIDRYGALATAFASRPASAAPRRTRTRAPSPRRKRTRASVSRRTRTRARSSRRKPARARSAR